VPFPVITKGVRPVRRVYPTKDGSPLSGGTYLQFQQVFSNAPGLRVPTAGPTRAVMLDPEFTSPGSIIAVMPKGGSIEDAQYLRPGDIAIFPEAVESFYAWNVLGRFWANDWQNAAAFWPSSQQVRVAFLAAESPELLVERQRLTPARQKLSVLHSGAMLAADMNVTTAPRFVFFASGLRALRISVLPLTALGKVVTPTPADFAATVRPWVVVGGTVDEGIPGELAFVPVTADGSLDGPLSRKTTTPLWVPNMDGDLAVTADQMTFDREVVAGALGFGFSFPMMAGTGVTTVLLQLEAY
jgi:hypothetical protein